MRHIDQSIKGVVPSVRCGMSVVAKPRMGGHYLEKGRSERGKMKYIYIHIYL